MPKLFPPDAKACPAFDDWLKTRLPKIPDTAKVWDAFCTFSGVENAKAREAVEYDRKPIVFLETMFDTDGYFDGDRKDFIFIRKSLVGTTSLPDEPLLERTVLHELVHWAWASLGRTERFDEERGEDFERAAYTSSAVVRDLARTSASRRQLGELSARWESHGKADAIGRDTKGGWSYGLYQIATRTGTMVEFLTFLDRRSEWERFATTLRAAGGNTDASIGSKRFFTAWKQLGAEPAFADAQHDFIEATHYQPFVAAVTKRGIDVANRSWALKNVTWSVGVQHGVKGGTLLYERAAAPLGTTGLADDARLISAIYTERKRVDVYFAGSEPAVRESVRKRFDEEQVAALAMLRPPA
jgi:hypothetical protein